MLNFLTNGIRRVLGLLDEADAEMAEVEERLADFAERTERAESEIMDLGERFLAMAEAKPVNRNGRNGKPSRRRAAAKKK